MNFYAIKKARTGLLLSAIRNNDLPMIKNILELGADVNNKFIIRALAENTSESTLNSVILYSKYNVSGKKIIKMAYTLNNKFVILFICRVTLEPNHISNEIVHYLIDNCEFDAVRDLVSRGLKVYRWKLDITWKLELAERKLNDGSLAVGCTTIVEHHHKRVDFESLRKAVTSQLIN